MHIHASQLNLNAELFAAQSSARREARLAAEFTRKKLRDFASVLAGEAGEDDYYVVALGAKGESQSHSNHQNGRGASDQQEGRAQPDSFDDPFSSWA